MSGLQVISAPAVEPVDLATMKNFLRVSSDVDDNLIGSLIQAARAFCENYTGRTFISCLLRYTAWPLSAFCVPTVLVLPRPLLISVQRVQVKDWRGECSDLSSDDYLVEEGSDPARLVILERNSEAEGYVVDYLAGYGDTPAMVPSGLRIAVQQLVAFWYENRGDVSMLPPVSVLALLNPHKVISVGAV